MSKEEKALEAIKEIYSDHNLSVDEVVATLKRLIEEIEILLDTLII